MCIPLGLFRPCDQKMKSFYILAFIFISLSGHAQSWEILNEDYTYVYDITSHGSLLHMTGLKDGHFIFASSDNHGDTWHEVILDHQITLELGIPISVGFFNDQEGMIGIKGNFTQAYLKTEDGGKTWHAFTLNLGQDCDYIPQPFKIVIVNDSTAIVSQFQSGNFIISHDGGHSWECNYDFTTSWLPKITALNDQLFFNFDSRGLYQSEDGGSTWVTVVDTNDLTTYTMIDEQTGFAASAYYQDPVSNPALYFTNDSWNTFVTTPLEALNDKLINSIVPISAEEIFFFEADHIHYTPDAGQTVTFHQELGFEPISAIHINGEWYVTGRGLARYNPDGNVNSSDDPGLYEGTLLYPNPVTNSRIQLTDPAFTEYRMFNLYGQLVEEGLINDGRIILKSSVRGIHLLSVQGGNQAVLKTARILIE